VLLLGWPFTAVQCHSCECNIAILCWQTVAFVFLSLPLLKLPLFFLGLFYVINHYLISQKCTNFGKLYFDKHELILVIFGKQRQHTFRYDAPIQLSLSHHFCLLYLLLSSSDRNDANCNMFATVGCWWLWKSSVVKVIALKKDVLVYYLLFVILSVQSDVFSLSCMYVTIFSIDQQLRWWCFVILYAFPCANKALLQVVGVMDGCIVHALLSPNLLGNRV